MGEVGELLGVGGLVEGGVGGDSWLDARVLDNGTFSRQQRPRAVWEEGN